jgi:hypothetical protein
MTGASEILEREVESKERECIENRERGMVLLMEEKWRERWRESERDVRKTKNE